MTPNKTIILSGLAGIIAGILSTYPAQMEFVPSLIFWTMVGLGLGSLAKENRTIVLSGILFGVFLSFAFLFSRFGDAQGKILYHAFLAAGMGLVGAVAGIGVIFLGSQLGKLRDWFK